MGAIEEMTEEARALHKRFDAYLTAREVELHEQAIARKWKTPTELMKEFKLGRDSVRDLVREGKAAGVVRAVAFTVSKGGAVQERVEVDSFERYLDMGGIDADVEGGAA